MGRGGLGLGDRASSPSWTLRTAHTGPSRVSFLPLEKVTVHGGLFLTTQDALCISDLGFKKKLAYYHRNHSDILFYYSIKGRTFNIQMKE